MIYNGLEFSAYFEIPVNSNCYSFLLGTMIIFGLLSFFALFLLATIGATTTKLSTGIVIVTQWRALPNTNRSWTVRLELPNLVECFDEISLCYVQA